MFPAGQQRDLLSSVISSTLMKEIFGKKGSSLGRFLKLRSSLHSCSVCSSTALGVKSIYKADKMTTVS